jgi:hypothetical protein
VLAARGLEVDRDARRQRRDPLDLRLLHTRQNLDMDVSGEAVLVAEKLEHGDEVIHHLDWPARNAGGDEQTLTPPTLPRGEKDAHQLFWLEQGARHLAIAPHRAVVAIEAARVGHENPEQRRLPSTRPARSDSSKIEGTERADLRCVPEPRRQRYARVPSCSSTLVIRRRQRHQQRDLIVDIQFRSHHPSRQNPPQACPNKDRSTRAVNRLRRSRVLCVTCASSLV